MLRKALFTPKENVTSLLIKVLLTSYFTVKTSVETCHYQIGLKLTNNAFKVLSVLLPSIILTILIMPPLCFLLTFMWAYRVTIETVLSIREGKKFGGLLLGTNVVTIMKETNMPSLIYTVLFVDYPGNIDDFKNIILEHLKCKFRNEPKRWWKLLTTRHEAYGYHYLRCNEVNVEDLVKIKEFNQTLDFNEKFNDHVQSQLPNRGIANFDVAIFERTMEGYPVILRCHHCLADGPSFYNVVSGLFMTNNALSESYIQNLIKKFSQKTEEKPWREEIWTLLNKGMNAMFVTHESYSLFGDVKSDTHFCSKWETDGRYMAMVKAIRKRMPGVSFYAIMLGIYSASLSNYCIRKLKHEKQPQHFSSILPKQVNSDQVSKCYKLEETAKFTNKMSLVNTFLMGIPSDKVGTPIEDYLVERIAFTQKQLNKAEESVDLLVYYSLMVTYGRVLPSFLLARLLIFIPVAAGSSSVPGGSEVNFLDYRLSNCFYFVPRLNIYGIALTYFTYGDRLQLGLVAYKSRQSLEDMKEILKDFFKYLEMLYEKSAQIGEFQLQKFTGIGGLNC